MRLDQQKLLKSPPPPALLAGSALDSRRRKKLIFGSKLNKSLNLLTHTANRFCKYSKRNNFNLKGCQKVTLSQHPVIDDADQASL